MGNGQWSLSPSEVSLTPPGTKVLEREQLGVRTNCRRVTELGRHVNQETHRFLLSHETDYRFNNIRGKSR